MEAHAMRLGNTSAKGKARWPSINNCEGRRYLGRCRSAPGFRGAQRK